MKKALVYASVASMIEQFNKENIRLLLKAGYEVHVGCNMIHGSNISTEKIGEMEKELVSMGVKVFHVPVPRKIAAFRQIFTAFRLTKKLMNENGYDLVHCHSPIGGMICRLANRFSKHYKKTKMVYTAHGFHFFRGAPLANWILFYPVESICSRFTDVVITINKEDFAFSQKLRLKKGGFRRYVPGIGIDTDFIDGVESAGEKIREELGLGEKDVILLSVGELNDNKNHKVVVEALPSIPENFHYLICGKGGNREMLAELAESLSCEDRLHVLGFRSDVLNILKGSDIFVFPSFREGLSVALMEAMAAGKSVVATGIRGNTDLVDPEGGVLFDPSSSESFIAALQSLLESDYALKGEYNKEKIRAFSKEKVSVMMEEIYAETEGSLSRKEER